MTGAKATRGMEPFSGPWLDVEGFCEFRTIASLRADESHPVPQGGGVYLVIRENDAAPTFQTQRTGGWFKGRDPSVPVTTLKGRWSDGARVVYVGKANDLRRRLRELLDSGAGKPVGHWGGRYLWQLDNANTLLVAWQVVADPLAREGALLDQFYDTYGMLPYANLRR